MALETKDKDYCGSCYGGLPTDTGCCNTCEQVREAYVRKGWSFSDPDGIEQVSSFFVMDLEEVFS